MRTKQTNTRTQGSTYYIRLNSDPPTGGSDAYYEQVMRQSMDEHIAENELHEFIKLIHSYSKKQVVSGLQELRNAVDRIRQQYYHDGLDPKKMVVVCNVELSNQLLHTMTMPFLIREAHSLSGNTTHRYYVDDQPRTSYDPTVFQGYTVEYNHLLDCDVKLGRYEVAVYHDDNLFRLSSGETEYNYTNTVNNHIGFGVKSHQLVARVKNELITINKYQNHFITVIPN